MSESSDDKDSGQPLNVHPGGLVDGHTENGTANRPNRPDDLPLTRESKRSVYAHRAWAPRANTTLIKPTVWTEDMLLALEPHEHDFQEFKGSGWILRGPKEIQPDFMYFLSKQVSAFTNGSGGLLFIGLDDNGEIDGGVPVDLKGGGTRAWLEDLVSACVDPPIGKCNIFEIVPGDRGNSRIKEGHGVYVLELPASQEAPHQAKDHRYYLRIAGKSRPMGHLHVQDVLRRTFHPQVDLSRFGPYGEPELDSSDSRGPRAFVQFRSFVVNRGRTLARHVGLELIVPRDLVGRDVRRRMKDMGESRYTQSPGQLGYFHYYPSPVFPSQEIYGMSIWVCIHGRNLAHIETDAAVRWTIFADDAAPKRGQTPLKQFQIIQRAIQWVKDMS